MTAATADAPSELLLTDEQLTLLARDAGEPAFPGARPRTLDEAGWEAVAHGLAARGIAGSRRHVAHAVLGVVLAADRSLWMTVAHAPGEGEDRHEILWLLDGLLVRQTVMAGGLHRFHTGSAAAGAVVDAVLGASGAAPSEPELVTEAEYAAALEQARRVVRVEGRRRVGRDRFEGEELTLVESPAHGPWLARTEPEEGEVVLRRLDAAGLAALVMALV